MQVNFDEFPGFSTKFRSPWNCAINRRNFMTPIVSFRAIIRDAWSFKANFRAIIRAARNFAANFRANFRFVCQFSSISGQCFAAFEIQLDINHLCGAVVREKSSCDPSAYAVSRSAEPISGNCCVKLTWLFSKESPTVYYTWVQKRCSSNMFRIRSSEWYLFNKH